MAGDVGGGRLSHEEFTLAARRRADGRDGADPGNPILIALMNCADGVTSMVALMVALMVLPRWLP
eukprot:6538569-Prymnesium_polylepis.1